MIPEPVERRARWVLDAIGGHELGFGDDVPYVAEAWAQLDRGELPDDDVAAAFFHLARVEEREGRRDEHGRFRAAWSTLDPLDPPLERLRRKLGLEPPRWGGARFAVALTHDVDSPWRWTRTGVRRAASRAKAYARVGRPAPALRELRSLGGAPLHRLRGTDPNWNFERLLAEERRLGACSTFFVLAGHRDRHDGAAPETYDRLRPRLVQTILEHGGEVGLHGSYTAADDTEILRAEREVLTALARDVTGQRYHYLRVDPHRNLRPLAELGFAYDTTLGWPDAVGFRGGIAHPFRPWDLERDQPLDLLELPLAAMDATLAESRYLGLSARAAWPRLERLLDWAAANGGGFSVLWHPDRFARPTSAGWDGLYYRFVEGVTARGGVCVSAAELAAQASSSHSTWSK